MLPWEHAAIAYLLYSGYSRWCRGALPAARPVLVVLIASQLPDLLDKPLAWQFGLVPSGRSVAHSAFIAVPLALAALELARRRDGTPLGAGFAIGYLSHLATDAVPLYPGRSTSFASVLWPLVEYEPATQYEGFLEQTLEILTAAATSLAEPSPSDLTGLAFVGLLLGVWLLDGAPGARPLLGLARRRIDAIRTAVSRRRSPN
ncbi:metal-dependent hydrolase [Halosolutus gelatinilyticus]|uniref:metal-dependent hydrolase n=1 Tax=Halosolutus gelatinilyticus TaxID=2931975 RepID=UPI001FF47458|nr:metal-dependent hydrolase [Halosolutus gelatinilyticus]